jgi:hypothetical protein
MAALRVFNKPAAIKPGPMRPDWIFGLLKKDSPEFATESGELQDVRDTGRFRPIGAGIEPNNGIEKQNSESVQAGELWE